MACVLDPRPLTREAFSPFGEVIATEGAQSYPINEGTTTRFHDLAEIDVAAEGGKPLVSIFRATARPRPIRLWLMERHPLASQAFYPLSDRRWLVVVGAGDDPLDRDALVCFTATGQQGINYRRGVWHHPLLVLDPTQNFLIVDRGGPGKNIEEQRFPHDDPVLVSV